VRAYTAFVRDFPSSPQASKAKEQLSLIERQIEAQSRELAARAEHERQERAGRELAERIRNGALTPQQWAPILRGRSMEEVKKLLGVPVMTHQDGTQWVYRDKFMSVSGQANVLIIDFGYDGIVKTFQENYSGTPIRP